MLSSYSPSTCPRAPGSPRGQLVRASGASGLEVAPQGMPLDCLVLMASRVCIPVSHGTITTGETIPRAQHISQTKVYPQSFFKKGLFAFLKC